MIGAHFCAKVPVGPWLQVDISTKRVDSLLETTGWYGHIAHIFIKKVGVAKLPANFNAGGKLAIHPQRCTNGIMPIIAG